MPFSKSGDQMRRACPPQRRHADRQHPPWKVRHADEPGNVPFRSADTVAAISSSVLDKVHRALFTHKPYGAGYWPGLVPMVYGFVKQSHGRLDIDTRQTWVPPSLLSPEAMPREKPPPGTAAQSRTCLARANPFGCEETTQCVLINQEGAKRAWYARPRSCEGCRRGHQVFPQPGNGKDLLLTDVGLPAMNG